MIASPKRYHEFCRKAEVKGPLAAPHLDGGGFEAPTLEKICASSPTWYRAAFPSTEGFLMLYCPCAYALHLALYKTFVLGSISLVSICQMISVIVLAIATFPLYCCYTLLQMNVNSNVICFLTSCTVNRTRPAEHSHSPSMWQFTVRIPWVNLTPALVHGKCLTTLGSNKVDTMFRLIMSTHSI